MAKGFSRSPAGSGSSVPVVPVPQETSPARLSVVRTLVSSFNSQITLWWGGRKGLFGPRLPPGDANSPLSTRRKQRVGFPDRI